MKNQKRFVGSLLIIAIAGGVFGYQFFGTRVHAQDQAFKKGNPVNAAKTQLTVRSGGEKPVTPEKNPPGDIPDSQAFVKYISPSGGYELQVPEGWARTVHGTDVSFVDKYDGLTVKVSQTNIEPTLDGVRNRQVIDLEKGGRAVKVIGVNEAKKTKEKAIIIAYQSNSDPNPVTGKQIRLENNSYIFYKNGKMAVLTLWAPLGADNVDQWRLISNSFKWRQ